MKQQLIYNAPCYSSHLLDKLQQQYKRGENCDVLVRVRGSCFLSQRSVLLAVMQKAELKMIDNGLYTLDIDRYSSATIKVLIDMMYTGELLCDPDLVDCVGEAATSLGFEEAAQGCKLYTTSMNETNLAGQVPINVDPEPVIMKQEPETTEAIPEGLESTNSNSLTTPTCSVASTLLNMPGQVSQPDQKKQPQSQTILPQSQTILPQSQTILRLLPQSQTILPQSQTILPQSQTILPQSQTILPQSQSQTLLPQSQTILRLLPQSQTLLLQSQRILPQTQTKLPQSQTIRPQSQTIQPQSQTILPGLQEEMTQGPIVDQSVHSNTSEIQQWDNESRSQSNNTVQTTPIPVIIKQEKNTESAQGTSDGRQCLETEKKSQGDISSKNLQAKSAAKSIVEKRPTVKPVQGLQEKRIMPSLSNTVRNTIPNKLPAPKTKAIAPPGKTKEMTPSVITKSGSQSVITKAMTTSVNIKEMSPSGRAKESTVKPSVRTKEPILSENTKESTPIAKTKETVQSGKTKETAQSGKTKETLQSDKTKDFSTSDKTKKATPSLRTKEISSEGKTKETAPLPVTLSPYVQLKRISFTASEKNVPIRRSARSSEKDNQSSLIKEATLPPADSEVTKENQKEKSDENVTPTQGRRSTRIRYNQRRNQEATDEEGDVFLMEETSSPTNCTTDTSSAKSRSNVELPTWTISAGRNTKGQNTSTTSEKSSNQQNSLSLSGRKSTDKDLRQHHLHDLSSKRKSSFDVSDTYPKTNASSYSKRLKRHDSDITSSGIARLVEGVENVINYTAGNRVKTVHSPLNADSSNHLTYPLETKLQSERAVIMPARAVVPVGVNTKYSLPRLVTPEDNNLVRNSPTTVYICYPTKPVVKKYYK